MIKHSSNEHGYFLAGICIALFLLSVAGFLFFARLPTPMPVPMPAPAAQPPVDATAPETSQADTPKPDIPWIGYVGDALSRPIPGARISLETGSSTDSRTVLADDRGKFLLLLPPGQFPLVTIEADGYYRTVAELDDGQTSTHILYRGGTIEGQVLGHSFVLRGAEPAEPKPIPGATLEVAGVHGWFDVVTADEEGKYKVTAPPGNIVVTARSPIYADARFDGLEVARDESLARDFILPAGVTLDAFVIGEKVTLQGARLRVFNEIKDEADAFTEGQQGTVSIKGLNSGVAQVHIVHPGYQEQLWDIIIPNDRIGIRKPFSMQKSQPFQLTVLDPKGQPLPDARVRIRQSGITIVDTVASDQEWLNVLASGETYQIEARFYRDRGGPEVHYPPRVYRYKMPEEGPGELTIQLKPGSRITGMVVAPNGSPVAGASILVRSKNETPGEASPPRILKTNQVGVFRSEPFATGKWGLTISHPQLGTIATETIVEEGKTSSLGQLQFPRR